MRDVFVGRQPVFDRDGNVVAYELLFRASQSANNAMHDSEGSQLTASVLVGALMDIGLNQVSGGKMVYINAPRDFLVSDIASSCLRNPWLLRCWKMSMWMMKS